MRAAKLTVPLTSSPTYTRIRLMDGPVSSATPARSPDASRCSGTPEDRACDWSAATSGLLSVESRHEMRERMRRSADRRYEPPGGLPNRVIDIWTRHG